MGLDKEEMELIRPLCLITAKPTMYVANVSEDGFTDNPLLDQLKQYAESQNAPIVAICAAIESEIVELPEEDRAEFLSDMGMDEPGLDVYKRQLQHYHRRNVVSRSCSGWEGVVPTCYGHQA